MFKDAFPAFIQDHYELHEWRHATAILRADFPTEWQNILDVLTDFRLLKSEITSQGGNKSSTAKKIDAAFNRLAWYEKGFQTSISIDNHRIDSPTHKVDCYKNRIALEIEWNNKDPFYDRDLNNFRLLFELRAISVGVIITRCDELQEIFDNVGRGASYGAATTHMSKLLPRLEGGSGGGCPVLVFGISKKLYIEDVP